MKNGKAVRSECEGRNRHWHSSVPAFVLVHRATCQSPLYILHFTLQSTFYILHFTEHSYMLEMLTLPSTLTYSCILRCPLFSMTLNITFEKASIQSYEMSKNLHSCNISPWFLQFLDMLVRGRESDIYSFPLGLLALLLFDAIALQHLLVAWKVQEI